MRNSCAAATKRPTRCWTKHWREAAERSARDEALLRAFDASGRSVEDFADMYGLEPRAAARSLERARRLRPPDAGRLRRDAQRTAQASPSPAR